MGRTDVVGFCHGIVRIMSRWSKSLNCFFLERESVGRGLLRSSCLISDLAGRMGWLFSMIIWDLDLYHRFGLVLSSSILLNTHKTFLLFCTSHCDRIALIIDPFQNMSSPLSLLIRSPALIFLAAIVFVAVLSLNLVICNPPSASIAPASYATALSISFSTRHHDSCSCKTSHPRSCRSCGYVRIVTHLRACRSRFIDSFVLSFFRFSTFILIHS